MTLMKPRVLQLGRLLPALEARLAADYDVTLLAQQADPRAFLAARGREFVEAVTSAPVGIDAALLEALPEVRVVSSFGVGLDRIDLAAAARRGVAVGYTPNVLNDCVADIAFTLLLDVARRASEADRFVRRGGWLQEKFPLATRVSGKRLGIVGMGRIGRTVAKRASGFDMEIRYHDRNVVSDVPYGHEASLPALARWAEFLVVAAAGGPGSRGLISAEVLQALGPQGFLVNIARGTLVDEAALVRALQDKRIAGAGLDVFLDEPRVPEALLALDNVVLTPHVASGTHETRQAMADLVLENLRSFFERGEVRMQAPVQ
ncbi:2-hydroxyacid dehydrogenase [Azohydromonas caseinilytica]|uniref:2-hydroxyacid dehydrogenase n=1 Tax=Azohydromonas caseinilytica TaxID=2728836 RepID=A0A848F9B3_9BURK|nr:2-hydroxyacid dehydrogenase [Azohydromonas caseinilytica]NML15932.1 2-hydroxyacid dehydrogenase [Azohydromonas caseinilytica]